MANDFDELKGRVNILDIIRSETSQQVKKVGISWFNLQECPFCHGHECFRIHASKQYFNCFQCDAGGSVFNFIQDLHNKSGYESLVYLAEKVGYNLDNGQPEDKGQDIRQEIFQAAADYYHQKLLDDEKARSWLSRKRGHTVAAIKTFMIGWSGSGRNSLLNHLKKSFKEPDLIASGLIRDRDGQTGDFLPKNVYIFPHFINKKVSHFTFKDPLKKVQYQLANQFKMNSHLFYGQNAFYHDTVVLVEGENDRITAMRVSGEKNIAAWIGQPSQDQIEFIKRHCFGKKVYFSFDHDPPDPAHPEKMPPGERYTHKIIDQLTGFVQVQIIRLPDKKDIDEYLRTLKTDPAGEYFNLLEKAVDGIQFQIQCLPDSDETIKISQLLHPVLERIAKVDDDILVEGYLELIKSKYPKVVVRTAIKKQIDKMKSAWQMSKAEKKEIPKDDFGLIEHENCYFKKSHDGSTVKISDFVLKLRKIFVMDDELHYECILKNQKKEVSMPVIFSPEDRAGLQQFRLKCVAQGSYYFYGTQAEVYRMWKYEEGQANIKEVIHYIQKYGYVPEHNLWLFENCAIKNGKVHEINQDGIIKIDSKGFKAKDVLVYSGDTPTMNITENPDPEFKNLVIDHFHNMIDDGQENSFKAYLALGFMAATVYLNEIANTHKCFPFFYPYGPSGTGKSASTSVLLSFFGFDGRSEPWESATPDGTFKFMEQLSSLPGWYDEYLNSTDSKAIKMLGITKNIYNRIGAGKGGIKKRQINVVNGTLWVSGEDSPVDKGLLSRCVVIRFTEITENKTASWKWLLEHQSRLSSILVDIIKNKTTAKKEKVLEGIEKFISHINANGVSDNRTAINYAIPAACFWLLDYHEKDQAFMDFVVEQCKQERLRKEEEDITVKFFNDLSYMQNTGRTKHTISIDQIEGILYICYNEIYNDWIRHLRDQGVFQIFKKTTILDYLKNLPYHYNKAGDNRARFGEYRKRAIAFDMKKMPIEIRDLFDSRKDQWDE
jgi:DNA primase catalytic core